MSEIQLTLSGTTSEVAATSDLSPPGSIPTTTSILTQAADDLRQAEISTPADHERVVQLAVNIDFDNSLSIIRYGSAAQRKIETFATGSIHFAQRDLSKIGDLFQQMQTSIEAFTDASISRGLIGHFRSSRKPAILQQCFTDTLNSIEEIQKQLEGQQLTLLTDIRMLEEQYRKLTQYYRELTNYTRAGQNRLESAEGQQTMQVLNHDDFRRRCQSLRDRLQSLEVTKTLCLQSALQTTLLLHIDRQLTIQIQNSLTNSVAAWQQNIASALTASLRTQSTLIRSHNATLINAITEAISIQKEGCEVESIVNDYQQTS